MRVLFATDLHGSKWKYERLFEVARDFRAKVVINGGDMLPGNNDLFRQGEFITGYLDDHFARFDSAGIYYLCYLGNDDLRIFDISSVVFYLHQTVSSLIIFPQNLFYIIYMTLPYLVLLV